MASTFVASHALEEESAPLDGGVARDTPPAALFSNWPPPVERQALRRREVYGVLIVSALLHGVLAVGAYRADAEPAPKRVSRVEIELTRPRELPKPATPAAVPPPPPKVVKQDIRPRPTAAPIEPPPTPVAPPPTDTGSSAPADAEGELHAGSAGLGTIAPTPPAPAAPAPAPSAPIVQAREGANYLNNPRPAYPRRAKREGWEGTAVLRVVVHASGKSGAIRVQKSSGHDVLDEAAVEAVTRWTFVPATRGGERIAGSVTVPIVFRLQ